MVVAAWTKLIWIEVRSIVAKETLLEVGGPFISRGDLKEAIEVLTTLAVTKEAHVELKDSSSVNEIGSEALIVTRVSALEVIQEREANISHARENLGIAVLLNALAIVAANTFEISGHTICWARHSAGVGVVKPKALLTLQREEITCGSLNRSLVSSRCGGGTQTTLKSATLT